MAQCRFTELLDSSTTDPVNKARLLAVSSKESGAWLRALPAASIGNLLDDNSLRIAVALRLGAPVSNRHQCVCSKSADPMGYHALSCRFSAGRHSRHAGVNAIVKRALNSAGVQSQLEPLGISRADGKRPDGVTINPWSKGKCLCWDATIVCTMAISHLPATSARAGAAATSAEIRKREKYQCLSPNFLFAPLGFETLGPWGPDAKHLLSTIGGHLHTMSGEPRPFDYLQQRISIEIQRGNAASVLGSTPSSSNLDNLFLAPHPLTGAKRPRF